MAALPISVGSCSPSHSIPIESKKYIRLDYGTASIVREAVNNKKSAKLQTLAEPQLTPPPPMKLRTF